MKLKEEKKELKRLEVEKAERESDSGYEGSEVEIDGVKKESEKERELRKRR